MDIQKGSISKKAIPILLVIAFFFAVLEYIDPEDKGEIPQLLSPQAEAADTEKQQKPSPPDVTANAGHSISGTINEGESLYIILEKNGLDTTELAAIERSTDDIYDLGHLRPGYDYTLSYSSDKLGSFVCRIGQDETLSIARTEDGTFTCERTTIEYERRVAHVGGIIRDNLVNSMGSLVLALELSEIFAWDIDFTTDLRKGDTYRLVVEELWHNGEFRKHGRILAAEFSNNGVTHQAYFHEHKGKPGYYDPKGKSMRRAFLKAPLSYRRISSGYGNRRHPITKRYQTHKAVDYAAPRGTPVSAVGDGTVVHAGYKGPNGNLVIIRHPNGYKTYYLHLHKIARGVRRGRKVTQGQVIGTVGSTGRATGPHLDFRIKKGKRFINPLKLVIPKDPGLPASALDEYRTLRSRMEARLSSIPVEEIARLNGREPGI